jgi:formate-dependent nitrite reductase membrane component NrfD
MDRPASMDKTLSVDKTSRTDGRDIDPELGSLLGEASHQIARPAEAKTATVAQTWEKLPQTNAADPTYYDRPMLKAPVWELYIPTYYFAGGAAGAALAMGAAAQFKGSPELRDLIRRAHWVGIAGSSIGGVLLILDLGRPERFLHMLRVFRPTSPMNVGAWILAGAPAAALTAGLFVRSRTSWRYVGEVAGYISGLLGLGLATYTGVLVANTAVPVWQESRHVLPLLFGASGMSAAGSILNMFDNNRHARAIVRNYAIAGATGELAAAYAMERQASKVEQVGLPFRAGVSGALWRTAAVLTAASIVTQLIPRRTRGMRIAAGLLGALGSMTLRYAVHYAGEQSARDPRATFHLQRARDGFSGDRIKVV